MASSAGSEAVDLAKAAGLELDDWQRWTLAESLSERRDGTWSAFEVGLVVGRQNGKNVILEARELAGVVLFGDDLIVHTAHRADTVMEHFRRMERFAEEFDEFGRMVKAVSRQNGHEAIELKGGRRIKFVSRARQPGRGLSGSCVIFDEALHLDPSVIGSLIPSLATREMAQVWYTSSAPKANSVVLHSVTARGRSGVDDDRLFYAEWGNDPDADPADRDSWYRANPGLGIRISEDYIAAEMRLMSGDADLEGEFRRERLGVAEMPEVAGSGPISLERWEALTDGQSMADEGVRLGLDAPPDRRSATFGVAGRRQDGLLHVATRRFVPPQSADHPEPVRDRVVELAKSLTDGHGTPLVMRKGSPALLAWHSDLVSAGVPVDVLSTDEFAEGCGSLLSAVADGSIRHRGQPEMTTAVRGLGSKLVGEVEVFTQRNATVDVAPVMAATAALVRVTREVGHAPFVVVG